MHLQTIIAVVIFITIFTFALFAKLLLPTKYLVSFAITQSPFSSLQMSKTDHQLLVSMMDRLNQLLNRNKVSYFLVAGSLMGALRYKNRMPWDDDIDIGILDNQTFAQLDFASVGLGIREIFFGYKVFDLRHTRRVLLEPDFPFIDVFIYEHTPDETLFFNNSRSRHIWPREKMPINYVYPLGQCVFANLKLSCPGQADKFLDQAYPGWQTTAYIQGTHTAFPLVRNYKMPINAQTTSEVLTYLAELQ